ncbi:MAG TPA: PmoA family protein [Tepidisphaeraceae bacterium]|nr:PmoA family protein [Tepidisphaeraceae bacterium]
MRIPALLAVVALCSIHSVLAAGAADQSQAIKIVQADTHLDVTIGGKPFTSYWFGKRDDRLYVRPFFFPVLAPGDVAVTSDQYSLKEREPKTDHPHHQSLWVAQGDVNGVDHWSLGKDGKGTLSAKQRHVKFASVGEDRFAENLLWDDNAGKPMLDEVRTVKFVGYPDGSRGIDITSAFTPAEGSVTFGDTKEAGLMAVRLATAIAKHPTITQSSGKGGEGAAGEKQTWGQPADWCDESGEIDGKPFGVAIFDFPANPRHPARWHVRAYGLMSSNIFGLSDFDKKNPKHSGDLVIEKGTTVTFRHRAVIHAGMAVDAKLGEKYKEFAGE